MTQTNTKLDSTERATGKDAVHPLASRALRSGGDPTRSQR